MTCRSNERRPLPSAPAALPAGESKEMRLQVYLAHAGVASRRSCEALITAGRVTVNGQVAATLGAKALPGDEVCLDGKPVRLEKARHYVVLNKPPGFLCSASDEWNRPLARSLLPADIKERLYNVGRLDFESSGLVLFTNDGDFAARTAHPASKIEKQYIVESTVPVPDAFLERFAQGLEVEGVFYKCLRVERLDSRRVDIVLIEGKNREIRRVFSHFHLHPRRLVRVRIGPVTLGSLAEGKTRPLTRKELEGLNAYGHSH